IPERLEAPLIVEPIDEGTTIDPETGEAREPEDPEIDPVKFEQYRDQIDERDVTPHDFGRIAAQTAKQVILQRIREAERDMMFEEYRDRVAELVTGLVQQSHSRYTPAQLPARRSPACPAPTAWTRWAPAWARAGRGCAWWSPSCAARRSTSSPTTTSPPASWPRRSRPPACARSTWRTRPGRPRSWSPTTSCRWRSGARASTPGWRPASPAGAWTSSPRPSSPPRRATPAARARSRRAAGP